jgi:alginate O-acetyltransferase complex protein AlgI
MSADMLVLLAGSLAVVPIGWLLPARWAFDGIAAWTLLVLGAVAQMAAAWLVLSSAATVLALWIGDRTGRRGLVTAVWAPCLAAMMFLAREEPYWVWIGGAYFTLRNMHVLFEWWMGRLARPSLRAMAHYQLFLPVIMSGPIHRMPHFQRACLRRRFDASDLASGAERALLGLAQAVVLGAMAMQALDRIVAYRTNDLAPFVQAWIGSAIEWVTLYFTFAGFSSVALGIALMCGLTLEENFDRPYLARSLAGFWARWHMTLSFWCRDYVFQPVSAMTRSAFVGLLAGMVAMGVWHDLSAYYLLWAAWHAVGIAGNRLLERAAERRPALRLPAAAQAILAPVCILGWLSLAKPVLALIPGVVPP